MSVVATGVAINATNNVRAATPSRAPAPPQVQGPDENPAVDTKSIDVHEAVIAELARRLKAEKAHNMGRAEMPETPAPRAARRG